MKAVVFHDVGDIRLDDVPEPKIEQPTDAIIRTTASAICGTDLHMVRGTMAGMKEGTVLGHEAVGVIEEVGQGVRNLRKGDRVVIPSTIACGFCSYCRDGYQAQCDNANPHGNLGGTAFYGGPEPTGPFHGLQAEYARIPYANVGAVKLPDDVSDDQAILISDIFPTGYFGAHIAEIRPGDTVAVLGCGPVGQFAILSAQLFGASRVIAIDTVEDRLAMAVAQGAEVIDFNAEDPVEAVRGLTGGIGVDAMRPHEGPAAQNARQQADRHDEELAAIAAKTDPQNGNWVPGDAPSQALDWAVQLVAKAGTLSIIGVYPPNDRSFPIGLAMNKNLSINMGNCNHRRYIPDLVGMVRSGRVDPLQVLTKTEPMASAIDAYKTFDKRQPGWMKVELRPAA